MVPITNTATVTGTGACGDAISVTSSPATSVTVSPASSLTIAKSANPETVSKVGDVVGVPSYLVTNTGDTTITGLAISDSRGLTVSGYDTTLAPGATTTGTATTTVTQADLDTCLPITNTGTVTGTGACSAALSVTSSPATSVTVSPDSSLTITKSASPTSVSKVGDVITYSYLVTNTGDTTITGIAISDSRGLTVSGYDTTLAPGATTTGTATTTVTQADLDTCLPITNTGTVTGTGACSAALSVTSSPATSVDVSPASSLTIAKSANPETVSKVGDVIAYAYLVTNTGDTTITGLAISDSRGLTVSGYGPNPGARCDDHRHRDDHGHAGGSRHLPSDYQYRDRHRDGCLQRCTQRDFLAGDQRHRESRFIADHYEVGEPDISVEGR